MCNEPGREGGPVPTKTNDGYLLYLCLTNHKHGPLTYNGLFTYNYNNSPSNYSSIHQITVQRFFSGEDSQRPTSAARTESHPMLYRQSPNKPGCVRGCPK